MKKFIRFVVGLILVVVVAVLVLALIEPKDVTVSRSILIKAPKDVVFEQIVKFKNWPHWSPWYKMDSGVQMTYTGTDGELGSMYHWVGDPKKTGEGDMKNTGVNGTKMDYALTFLKPHEGNAAGFFNVTDTAGMSKVVWSISMHTPFPLNAMLVFMNMDKMMGGDFENGLNYMKTYVESHSAASAGGADVQVVDYPAHTFIGKRSMVAWADMTKYFGDTYGMLGKIAGNKINGNAAGIYYTWDTINKRTDMAAVFPVSDTSTPIKEAVYSYIPASKAYMAVEKGGYSGAMAVHNAISHKLAADGKTQYLVIEEYAVGPHQEADSNKWITNVYYLVK